MTYQHLTRKSPDDLADLCGDILSSLPAGGALLALHNHLQLLIMRVAEFKRVVIGRRHYCRGLSP